MKKNIIALFAVSAALPLFYAMSAAQDKSGNKETDTQEELLLWPVKGKAAGEDIIYRPQEYIGGELNFSCLYIGTAFGDTIVAPADGTLISYGIQIKTSMTTMSTVGCRAESPTFDAFLEDARKPENSYPIPRKYVTGCVSIRLDDGSKIFISGLEGDREYKTGMKIRRGEYLGTAGYAYKEIEESHIELSVSTRKSTASDPMAPFGLKSTFIAPGKLVIPETLTQEKALEDFDILLGSIKELFPSVYDVVTPGQLATFDSTMTARIGSSDEISYQDFYDMAWETVAFIHDSHLNMLTPDPRFESYTSFYVPHIMFGKFGDSLTVTYVQDGYEDKIGKRIVSVDGIPADSYIQSIKKHIIGYDTENESRMNFNMASNWNLMYGHRIFEPRTTVLEFSDGEKLTDEWILNTKVRKITPPMTKEGVRYYEKREKYKDTPYVFEALNDSTAYFGLSTFVLDETQTEAVADSLGKYFSYPYMIIDLRDNSGGHVEIERKMLTWFLNEPSRETESYSYVNKAGGFKYLKYSMNYDTSGTAIIFPDAVKDENGDGYFVTGETTGDRIMPDSLLNYKGKLYVLTDETSISAASAFPATLVRNHRAVTVGRETASGYHFMTALKFAQIRLPNSYIMINVPLVKEVFDTAVTPRTPAGRGLMPDYPVPLSYEEIYTAGNDIVLDEALRLISEGKYLGEDHFAFLDEKDGTRIWPYIVICGLAAAAIIAIILAARHGRNSRRDKKV